MNQRDKAGVFAALHRAPGAFVMPNPWDAGSARLLTRQGFKALGSTSAGFAFSLGSPDMIVPREQLATHLQTIVNATFLPVSADLQNGFGATPAEVADSIRLAASCGVVGASIEDSTGDPLTPLFDLAAATERIAAAVEAARALPFPFTLTARAENFMVGRGDLDDALRRLQAYEEAGADVLYAPGVQTKEAISAIVGSVQKPVNVVMGLGGATLNVAELVELGVKRISLGSTLARAAYSAMIRAGAEIQRGTFSFAEDIEPFRSFNDAFAMAPLSDIDAVPEFPAGR